MKHKISLRGGLGTDMNGPLLLCRAGATKMRRMRPVLECREGSWSGHPRAIRGCGVARGHKSRNNSKDQQR